MAVSEFDLIERFFAPLSQAAGPERGVALGIGDDCALLEVPAGQQLAVSIDTLVEGVHFPADTPAAVLASRAFGACLSDLAAMAAEPAWFTLALTLPHADEAWLQAFSDRLAECAGRHQVALVGGDTTHGRQLVITIQVHGWIPRDQALRRDGAGPGDHVFVTGTLGDSAAGLDQLQRPNDSQRPNNQRQHDSQPQDDRRYLIDRFEQPSPRISTGLALRPFASAAIDISDGLLADLGHILERSRLGAQIEPALLPLSAPLQRLYDRDQALQWALSGGEDFELCFCIPEARLQSFLRTFAQHPLPCTRIGQLTADSGLFLRTDDGSLQPTETLGYRHF